MRAGTTKQFLKDIESPKPRPPPLPSLIQGPHQPIFKDNLLKVIYFYFMIFRFLYFENLYYEDKIYEYKISFFFV